MLADVFLSSSRWYLSWSIVVFKADSKSSSLKSYSPFGDSNLAIIGEVSMARNNNIINSDGNNGNLFNALMRAIKPSNPSIIGFVSATFLSCSAESDMIFASFEAMAFKFLFCNVSNSAFARLCLAIFSLKTGPLPNFFVPAVPSASAI